MALIPQIFLSKITCIVVVLLMFLISTVAAEASAVASVDKYSLVDNPNLHYYFPTANGNPSRVLHADVCIYGGTPAGIAAAVQLGRMGKTCVLLLPSEHLGGMTSSGLGHTDIGHSVAIGGIAREFYEKVGAVYGLPIAWNFEPHVATSVFEQMIKQSGAQVFYGQFLKSVAKRQAHIVKITMESGLSVKAKVFIDATYEGDLMAKAGVHYSVGREADSVYSETIDGVQVTRGNQFVLPVDPYVVAGVPNSGLLDGVVPGDPGADGSGDDRIQAYCFRLCLTKDPANRIPFQKPAGYNSKQYALLARYLEDGWSLNDVFKKFDPIPDDKVDKNNTGAISTDFIGANYAYPEASYAEREKIYQAHVTYDEGFMWFVGNDPRVPDAIRTKWSEWGLCKDEFQETGGWPPQLYVREARRMVSDYVMTEHNCVGVVIAPEPIAMGSYTMDSHNCERIVRDGHALDEGDVEHGGIVPYPISYKAIVPRESECDNLLVPGCLSASHIAYGSLRTEPEFFILGQSAGTAAALAIDEHSAIQDVDYSALRNRLLADKQVLSIASAAEE